MSNTAKEIRAECPACGARSFLATGESPDPRDVLTCESCGLKLSYAFLQNRMAEAGAPGSAPRRAKKKRKRATKKGSPPRSRRRRA